MRLPQKTEKNSSMVKVKKEDNAPKGVETVDTALTKTEKFIEQNQKLLTTIALVILGLAAAYMALRRFVLQPRESDAQREMYVAQDYFAQDSFRLALEGDGNHLGFLDIIDNYSFTKSARLSKYYAGLSYLHMGDFDEAIRYLKKFSTSSKMIQSMAYGALGDAYSEKEEYENALQYYTKAANVSANQLTTPIYLMKAALIYETQGNNKEALAIYERIKKDFPQSSESNTIDKYIARVKAKMEQ